MCRKELRQTKGSTSSLRRHLINYHPSLNFGGEEPGESQQELQRQRSWGSGSGVDPDVQVIDKTRQSSLKESFQKSKPYNQSSQQKAKLDRMLVRTIVKGMYPLSIVENGAFRDFVQALDKKYVMPTRTTIRDVILPEMYQDALTVLRRKLNMASSIGLTTDLWTNVNNSSFLSVTAHFVEVTFSFFSSLY